MAMTPLPSVATVNDAQLAAMLEVYGDSAGYQARMIQHILEDIKQFKVEQIHMAYRAALDDLDAQENDALNAVDIMLNSLVNP